MFRDLCGAVLRSPEPYSYKIARTNAYWCAEMEWDSNRKPRGGWLLILIGQEGLDLERGNPIGCFLIDSLNCKFGYRNPCEMSSVKGNQNASSLPRSGSN